jgi:hypothetical protein
MCERHGWSHDSRSETCAKDEIWTLLSGSPSVRLIFVDKRVFVVVVVCGWFFCEDRDIRLGILTRPSVEMTHCQAEPVRLPGTSAVSKGKTLWRRNGQQISQRTNKMDHEPESCSPQGHCCDGTNHDEFEEYCSRVRAWLFVIERLFFG